MSDARTTPTLTGATSPGSAIADGDVSQPRGSRRWMAIAAFVVGLALITVSLYSTVAPPAAAGAPRQVREGRAA